MGKVMARNVGRVSQLNTSYVYQPGRAYAEAGQPAIPFARILGELRGTVKPVTSHPYMMENAYALQERAQQEAGALYGWSYHDLVAGTVSFKTIPDVDERLVRFMERAAQDFNLVEATVAREVFTGTGLMPRGMSITFTDGGILHLMSGGSAAGSPEYALLLGRMNNMFGLKHKKQNGEWLDLLRQTS